MFRIVNEIKLYIMIIIIKLSEVLDKCSDWKYFCEEEGFSRYAVAAGGGDIDVELSEEEAKKFGIIKT